MTNIGSHDGAFSGHSPVPQFARGARQKPAGQRRAPHDVDDVANKHLKAAREIRIDWNREPRSELERQIRHAYLCACYDDPTQTGYCEIASLYGGVEAMLARAPSDVKKFVAESYAAEAEGRPERARERMTEVALGAMEDAKAEAVIVNRRPPELFAAIAGR